MPETRNKALITTAVALFLTFAVALVENSPATAMPRSTKSKESLIETQPGPKIIPWFQRWLVLVPMSPDSPYSYPGNPQMDIIETLADGDCSRTQILATRFAQPQRSLYEGVAAACLAAFNGRSDLWPIAGSRFDQIRNKHWECLDFSIFSVLRSFVTAHRADRSTTFEKGRRRGRCS